MQKLSFADPVAKTLTPQMCDALARRIKGDIDAWCVNEYTDEHRTHLGASVIGEDCARRIWMTFRWIRTEIFDGRMLRLFQRGHLEEQRIISYLRGAGWTVWDLDPTTGKQFRIWGAKGHYGGSSDAVGQTPYPELIGLNLLLEFKTHNLHSFKMLVDKGMIISKPQHYAQMCSYGVAFGFQYGMYVGVGKNDDDIKIEIVKLDKQYADDLVKKAEDIIFAQRPEQTQKISLQPSYVACTYCPQRGPCHFNEPVAINCRSCRHAFPIENAQWGCEVHKCILPPDFIPKGCAQHHSIL